MTRAHVLEVAHRDYTWEAQVETLLRVYRDLAPEPRAATDRHRRPA